MKRLLMILALSLTLLPLFSASFGYGVSYEGTAYQTNSENRLSLSLVADVTSDHTLTLFLSKGFGFDEEGFSSDGLSCGLTYSPFTFLHHPFDGMLNNLSLLSPELELSLLFREHEAKYLKAGFSLLHLEEVSFTYDFLKPYLLYEWKEGRVNAWGIELIKIACYF